MEILKEWDLEKQNEKAFAFYDANTKKETMSLVSFEFNKNVITSEDIKTKKTNFKDDNIFILFPYKEIISGGRDYAEKISSSSGSKEFIRFYSKNYLEKIAKESGLKIKAFDVLNKGINLIAIYSFDAISKSKKIDANLKESEDKKLEKNIDSEDIEGLINYSDMTKKELIELSELRNIEVKYSMTKNQIIEALESENDNEVEEDI